MHSLCILPLISGAFKKLVTVMYYKRIMAELAAGQRPCLFPGDSEPDENGLVCTGGELSAFSIINTSKLALHVLRKVLDEKKFDFIDCQQVTPHLMRLGAAPIPRSEYLALLQKTLYYDSYHESWQRYYKQKQSSDP